MSEFRPKLLLSLSAAAVVLFAVLLVGSWLIGDCPAWAQQQTAPGQSSVTPAPQTQPNAAKDATQAPGQIFVAYVWSATRSDGSIRLRGCVPSEDDHRTVLGMVKAHFPDLEVEDRLKVAGGSPAHEQWLGAVSFGLKQLTHLKQGSARLLNVGLRLDGEAKDAADYAELNKALAGPLPVGLSILANSVRPPVVDPFVFSAALDKETLTLVGSVPSEAARQQLLGLARGFFERAKLDDELELASGAPKDWNNAVAVALRALSRLNSGKIALSGLALTIEGVAPDKPTAVDVSFQLRHDLPALFSSSESITWKEAASSWNSAGTHPSAFVRAN